MRSHNSWFEAENLMNATFARLPFWSIPMESHLAIRAHSNRTTSHSIIPNKTEIMRLSSVKSNHWSIFFINFFYCIDWNRLIPFVCVNAFDESQNHYQLRLCKRSTYFWMDAVVLLLLRPAWHKRVCLTIRGPFNNSGCLAFLAVRPALSMTFCSITYAAWCGV